MSTSDNSLTFGATLQLYCVTSSVLPRVSLRRNDDIAGIPLLHGQVLVAQRAIRTAQAEAGQVGATFKQRDERLCLWVSESNVVLENFGSGCCDDDAGEENATKGAPCLISLYPSEKLVAQTMSLETSKGRPEYILLNLSHCLARYEVHGCIYTHATCIRTF